MRKHQLLLCALLFAALTLTMIACSDNEEGLRKAAVGETDTTLIFYASDFSIKTEEGGTYIIPPSNVDDFWDVGIENGPGLPYTHINIPIGDREDLAYFTFEIDEVLFTEEEDLAPASPSVPMEYHPVKERVDILPRHLPYNYEKEVYPDQSVLFVATRDFEGVSYEFMGCRRALLFQVFPFRYDVVSRKVYLCKSIRLHIYLKDKEEQPN